MELEIFLLVEPLSKKGTKLTAKRLKSYNLERFNQDESWVENPQTWKKNLKLYGDHFGKNGELSKKHLKERFSN